jgi:outer membrane protein assembly factor BamB
MSATATAITGSDPHDPAAGGTTPVTPAGSQGRIYPAGATAVQTGGMRTLATGLGTLALLVALAGCSGGGGVSRSSAPPARTTAPPTTPTAVPPAAATDWLQYHGNGARTGAVAGLPAAGRLTVAWTAPLGGAVYGQPLVVGATVIAATEQNDVIYGLDLATGAVRWHTSVGSSEPVSEQPCGDLNPLGITSTGVYDPQTGLVYFVAQSGTSEHVLVGLDPATGAVMVRQDVPSPDRQPYYDQQRGALALEDGYVYVVFGGHYGDCGPYIGSVVGMPATGHGTIYSYLVPTAKQGGIWAAGGPVVGPDGTIYVSTGNGAPTQGPYDGSDSVTALTPQLQQIGIFAPTDWRTLSADDLDLGSMSPALLASGQILQVGKSGTGYLLNAAHLGGVGGQVAAGPVCAAFGGAAISGSVVYVPCLTGLAAVNTAGSAVRVIWRGPADVWGSPVVGGGAVFVASPDTGVLDELSPATGQVRSQLQVAGALPHFVSPSLSGSLVLVGTLTGVTAVSGA